MCLRLECRFLPRHDTQILSRDDLGCPQKSFSSKRAKYFPCQPVIFLLLTCRGYSFFEQIPRAKAITKVFYNQHVHLDRSLACHLPLIDLSFPSKKEDMLRAIIRKWEMNADGQYMVGSRVRIVPQHWLRALDEGVVVAHEREGRASTDIAPYEPSMTKNRLKPAA